MFFDLDQSLQFGSSENWVLARGDTERGSFQCMDGGGYDISVTRDETSFTKLRGTIAAELRSPHAQERARKGPAGPSAHCSLNVFVDV